MDSSYIKACLSAYYRFAKQHNLMATEVGYFNSDFLTIKGNDMTEIEIKVSKADLNNDFKKQKHQVYEQNSSLWTPNYFYFCVPPEILDYTVAKCVDKPYGVMVVKAADAPTKHRRSARKGQEQSTIDRIKSYQENFQLIEVKEDPHGYGWSEIIYMASGYLPFKSRVKVVKRAKRMNNNIPCRKARNYILSRLSSEMTNLRIEFANLKKSEDKK